MSARPGHSEHQLGTAIDFRSADDPTPPWELDDFADTAAGGWLHDHAWEYGFVLSYPKGEAAETCYAYEPWHYRYVGRDVAAAIHASGETPRRYLWETYGPRSLTPSWRFPVREFIAGLPKCELHLHIEGTLEPELKFELAARNAVGLAYSTVDEMRAAYEFDDLASFLACYYEGMSVLLVEQDFRDLAMAYLRRAASQNVRYAEVFRDPQAHTSRGVPLRS